MKKISKAAEDRLVGAIEKTAALVNDGMHPNNAIAKAAAEGGIPPGHINLMVHAYNTGRTTRQRQNGGDPFEKSADFEMADAAQVLEELYPSQVKTAAAVLQNTAVSTQYAIPPTGILERRESRRVKAASMEVDWRAWSRGEYADEEGRTQQLIVNATPPPPLERDQAYLMKKAYCDADRRQREVNEARRQMHAAKDQMANTFMELTDHFKTAGAAPIPVVREQCQLLHGNKAVQLIDEVVKVTPGLMRFSQHKSASYDPNRLYSTDGEAYALVSQFLDDLDTYQQKKAEYERVHVAGQEAVENLLAPFVGSPSSVLDDPVFSTGSEKEATVMPMLMGGSLATNILKNVSSGMQGPDSGEVNSMMASLTDPAHEQELRNIRSSAALHDMMLNDPVLSSHPPDDVVNAFNEISEMSPRASEQRMLMQSLLRKRMEQGSLDPFEIDQLLGMEQKQQKIQQQPTGGPGDKSVLS